MEEQICQEEVVALLGTAVVDVLPVEEVVHIVLVVVAPVEAGVVHRKKGVFVVLPSAVGRRRVDDLPFGVVEACLEVEVPDLEAAE